MTNRFTNPWIKVILAQMWIVRQTTSMVARSIDTEVLCNPRAMTNYGLNPSEKRLNPMEFHGKRRAQPAQSPQTGNAEDDAASRRGTGQPRRLSACYAGVDRQGRRKS